MATVKRTFTNRGKHEVKDLKRGFTYAVEYTLNKEVARALGMRCDQIGIIQTDLLGNVAKNWNVNKPYEWECKPCDLKGKHVWLASEMEQGFAKLFTQHLDDVHALSTLREKLKESEGKYAVIDKNLHDTMIDLFNKTKQCDDLELQNDAQQRMLNYYESHPLHRFVQNIINIWGELKQPFKRSKDNG